MARFENSVVAITGAGSGIGREAAVAFAEEGASVVVADVDREGGEGAVAAIEDDTDGSAPFVEVDVTSDDNVHGMVETAVDEFGGLDAGINNAGIGGEIADTADYTYEDWQAVIDVNLTGVWRCLKHELDVMLDRDGGTIVNTASVLGRVGFESTPAYTAAKHGVVGLTKVAAQEYATEGIRVNAVCPGFVETQMLEAGGFLQDEEGRSQIEALRPMGRLGTSREIADAMTWLCSEEASFVTGESFPVDGGYLSR